MNKSEIIKLDLIDTIAHLKNRTFTCEQLLSAYLDSIKKNNYRNAILEVFSDAMDKAKKIDGRIIAGEPVGKLAGIPIIIKDNILYKGKHVSCASKILKDFISPYNSTVVDKLLSEDAIILGRANMDEFAMGGSTENSAYGPCLNAYDDTRVSGGSSGGSAVSVATNMCVFALGTDTGGSIRQPSSFNGVVGMKPTYGRVSRYGVVAYASSLDQVGPITKSVRDNAYVLSILAGKDEKDETTLSGQAPDYISNIDSNIKGMKIGYIKELIDLYRNGAEYPKFQKMIDFLNDMGAELTEINIPLIDKILPTYYVIATAEASSALGRFDGVKFTSRGSDERTIGDLYASTRTEGFGEEVKRRILLGNYVLSIGYHDKYYEQAKKMQGYIKGKFREAFESLDAIIMPVAYGEAFKLGEKNVDPVTMYLEDMFTVIANIVGIPAISVPYEVGNYGLPIGLQVLSKPLSEEKIFNVARCIEKNYNRGGVYDRK